MFILYSDVYFNIISYVFLLYLLCNPFLMCFIIFVYYCNLLSMANTPSYWTLKRKSRARVNQQLESICSGFASGNEVHEEEFVDACNEIPVNVEEDFMDCESSFAESEEFNDSF